MNLKTKKHKKKTKLGSYMEDSDDVMINDLNVEYACAG